MKFIVSDLDGTLLNNDSVVSEYTKDVLRKLHSQGIHFAIATGRAYCSTKDIKDSIGIPMYMICNNGANIYNEEEELIFNALIDANVVRQVVEVLQKFKVDYRVFNGTQYWYPSYGEKDPKRTQYDGSILDYPQLYGDADKIIMVENDRELYAKVKEIVIDKFNDELEIVSSSHVCLDFNVKGCSKKEGLATILKNFDVNRDEIIAFGDSENDYQMLSYVGYPVAMKKSYMSTKIPNVSDYTNQENGVAKYLEKIFMKK